MAMKIQRDLFLLVKKFVKIHVLGLIICEIREVNKLEIISNHLLLLMTRLSSDFITFLFETKAIYK